MRPSAWDLPAAARETAVWVPPAGPFKLHVHLVTGVVIVVVGAAALSLPPVVAAGGLAGVLASSLLIASALARPLVWGASWLGLVGIVWSLLGGGLLALLVVGIVVSLFLPLWATAAGVVLHLVGDRIPVPVVDGVVGSR